MLVIPGFYLWIEFLTKLGFSVIGFLFTESSNFVDLIIHNPLQAVYLIIRIQFGYLFLGSGLIYCVRGMLFYDIVLKKRKKEQHEGFRLTMVDFCLVASVFLNAPGLIVLTWS